MKTSSLRTRRHRNPQQNVDVQNQTTEQAAPFFSNGRVQTKSETAFFQPKLTIGKADDSYEREADAVADKVVSRTSSAAPATSSQDANALQKQEISSIQRLATPEEDKMPATNDGRMAEDKKIQEKPMVQKMEAPKEEEKPAVQKMEAPKEEEEPIQAKAEEEEAVQAKAEEEEPIQAKAEEEEPIQAKAGSGGGVASQAVTAKINSTKGRGNPLPMATKGKMESAFGRDFSDVHIHKDTSSVELNKELHAQAFTHGKDIYFNSGKFNPENREGGHLLAHELTHVVQQNNSVQKKVQLKAKSTRFQKDPVLEEVSDGKRTLKNGDSGMYVTKIEQGFSDLALYPPTNVKENYDPPFVPVVEKFQANNGKKITGEVDKQTFDVLDASFANNFKVEKDNLASQKAANLTANTRTLTDADRKGVADAISTQQVANAAGVLPTFVEDVAGKGKYGDRINTKLTEIVMSQYDRMGKGKAAQHADPKNLQDWGHIERVALASKKAVDAVFGEYTGGGKPAFVKNVNIFDAWDSKVKSLTAGGTAAEDAAVEWRVQKILSGHDEIAKIDTEHGAIQSRPAEAAIIKPIKDAVLVAKKAELLETHKGWSAFAGDGKVNIQLFKEGTAAKNRDVMWRLFRTVIHEYIHTLEHSDHVSYRKSLDEQKGGFTLREGDTDYFTKIVWSTINLSDKVLQKEIEGAYHDPLVDHPMPGFGVYKESEYAERLAGIVGVRNIAAAFFAGKVELIGKK